jgi:hypothetical protein
MRFNHPHNHLYVSPCLFNAYTYISIYIYIYIYIHLSILKTPAADHRRAPLHPHNSLHKGMSILMRDL